MTANRDARATTEYGYWSNVGNYREPIDEVRAFLAEFADEFDVDAIVSDYTAAINVALPEGVSLAGSSFHGPYSRNARPGDHLETIRAAVATVDLAAIVEQHTS